MARMTFVGSHSPLTTPTYPTIDPSSHVAILRGIELLLDAVQPRRVGRSIEGHHVAIPQRQTPRGRAATEGPAKVS